MERLSDLLDSDDPAIVLRASTLVLATATKFELVADLDQRVSNLETRAPVTEESPDDPGDGDDPFA